MIFVSFLNFSSRKVWDESILDKGVTQYNNIDPFQVNILFICFLVFWSCSSYIEKVNWFALKAIDWFLYDRMIRRTMQYIKVMWNIGLECIKQPEWSHYFGLCGAGNNNLYDIFVNFNLYFKKIEVVTKATPRMAFLKILERSSKDMENELSISL